MDGFGSAILMECNACYLVTVGGGGKGAVLEASVEGAIIQAVS